MRDREDVVERVLGERRRLFELLVSAVVLAVGINLLTSQLDGVAALVLGAVALVGALAYLVFGFLRGRSKSAQIDAFLIGRHDAGFVDVPGYAFSENLGTIIRRASAERPGWLEEGADGPAIEFTQAAEYLFLDDLSRELDKHFAGSPAAFIERDGLRDIVAGNRFLELFSTPLEERPAFEDPIEKTYVSTSGRTIAAESEAGHLFVVFELALPAGSEAFRVGEHKVAINTPRANIVIETRYAGVSEVPAHFPLYLGFDEPADGFGKLQFSCALEFTLRWRSLFSLRGWHEYGWIDSFLARYRRRYDGDAFLDAIGWATAQTTLRCLDAKSPERS